MIAWAITSLAPLTFLVCPIVMGLMMWMMARGAKSHEPDRGADVEPSPSLELLKEEHRRLGEQIERLRRSEGDSSAPPRDSDRSDRVIARASSSSHPQ